MCASVFLVDKGRLERDRPVRRDRRSRRVAARVARSYRYAALVTFTGLASFTLPLGAQSPGSPVTDTIVVSLAEARLRALRANPGLVATRLDTAVGRGNLRQARLIRFNPVADVLTTTGGDQLEAGVSQEIEIFGQRGKRISAARAGFDRAAAGVANATRLTIGEVDRTFYRLVSASQRTKLAEEVLTVSARLADVAGRQLREGEISRLDFNLATVELGRARARALVTRRDRAQAAINLGLLMGVPHGTPVGVVQNSVPILPGLDTARTTPGAARRPADSVPVLDVERLTAIALQRRPDLEERSAAVRQAESEASLARREALPNPVLRGVMEQPTRGGARTYRPGIGLTLPFLNRNQGQQQALRAAARQAGLERAALATGVRAQIASAVASYQAAATEVQVLEATVLAPARQNRQLVEVAYREGKVGLPVLLLIQNQAIDAELEYWTAWLESREALANLAEATGQNTEGLSGPAAAPSR